MRTFGGNRGYVGYSESVRSAEAKEQGRFPKTAFKKEYGISEKRFNDLVRDGTIGVTEWHHTSKFGNRTQFYGPLVEQWRFLYRIGDRSGAYSEYIRERREEEWLKSAGSGGTCLLSTFSLTVIVKADDPDMPRILSYGAPVNYTKRRAYATLPLLGWKHLLGDAFVRNLFKETSAVSYCGKLNTGASA